MLWYRRTAGHSQIILSAIIRAAASGNERKDTKEKALEYLELVGLEGIS